MNRAERRAQKCQPKKYTEAEFEKKLREATTAVARYNVRLTIAACGLVLHREFGFGQNRLERVFRGIDQISFDTLSLNTLRDQLADETGIDLTFFEDRASEGIW